MLRGCCRRERARHPRSIRARERERERGVRGERKRDGRKERRTRCFFLSLVSTRMDASYFLRAPSPHPLCLNNTLDWLPKGEILDRNQSEIQSPFWATFLGVSVSSLYFSCYMTRTVQRLFFFFYYKQRRREDDRREESTSNVTRDQGRRQRQIVPLLLQPNVGAAVSARIPVKDTIKGPIISLFSFMSSSNTSVFCWRQRPK